MPEPDVPEADVPEPDAQHSRHVGLRRAARVSGRVLAGLVAVSTSVVVVGIVAAAPLPTVGAVPDGIEVTPVPADALRVCPGGALRMGTEAGDDADTAYTLGAADLLRGTASGALPVSEELSDPGSTLVSPADAPVLLRSSADDEPVGAQSQILSARDYTGLVASACLEPTGTAWLVGGATTLGRSTLLSLVNPGEVDAVVAVRAWGEDGPVAASGMSGISVPAGARRVVSLAGFAPDIASPVLGLTVRGGRIVATLQQSVVRGLDAGGAAIVAPAAAASERLVIPGVRIFASTYVASASSIGGWEDISPAIRLLAPDDSASATVIVSPAPGQEGEPSSFPIELVAGVAVELPLTAGIEAEQLATLPDGLYTVTVEADAPVVAGVRVSVATQPVSSPLSPIPAAPLSDLAWFVATPALGDAATIAVAPGPVAVLSLVNPGDEDVEVVVEGAGLTAPVVVPAGAAAAIRVPQAGLLRLSGAAGLHASVSYAGTAQLAAFPVTPAQPLAGPVVIRP